MTLVAQYPMFVVVKRNPNNIVLIDSHKEGQNHAIGLAVFTDRDAAEEFRNKYHKGWKIQSVPDETALFRLLALLKESITEVVIDPWRAEKPSEKVPVGEMLELLAPI